MSGFLILSCRSSNKYSYKEIEVEYFNSKDGVKLAGTLTLPVSDKKVPSVLLIQGSGPYDRNEEILGHRLFEVIANALSEKRIAVLRADKRGVGKSDGQYIPFDIESFIEDAFAGVDFLKNHNRIDPNYVGLIGHSLGGLIAPIMASQSEKISFIVLMASPGEWSDELMSIRQP